MKKQFLSVFALALFAATAAAQTNLLRTVAEVAVSGETELGKEVYIVLGNNSAARINTEGDKVTGQAKGSLVRIVTVDAGQHLYKIYDVKSGKWFANKGGNDSAPKQDNQVILSDTPTDWFIYNNDNGSDATKIDIVPKVSGAAISDPEVASWNFYGGYGAGKFVGYWRAYDENSVWSLYDPKVDIKTTIDALAAADAEAAATAKGEIDAASDEAGYEAAIKKFRKALNGKKVRFFNMGYGAKNYLTLSSPSCVATGDATEAPGVEDVFVLNYDEAKDSYSLQHAVTGRRVNNVPGLYAGVPSTNDNNARYDLYPTGTNNTLSICNVTKNEDKNYLHLSKDTYTDGKLNVVRWNSGTESNASVWTLESASATDAEILAAAKTRFDSYKDNIGSELGKFYTTEEDLIEIVDRYEETSSLTLEEFRKLFSAYADKKFTLNLPEAGEFFRIKSNNGTRYITTKNATAGEWQLQTTTDAPDENTIFCFDGEHLVSLKTGRAVYLTNNKSQAKLAAYSVATPAAVEFGELSDGKYKVILKQGSQKATVHLWQQDNKPGVDGSNGDNTGNVLTHLQLEEVEKVPVHLNANGLASFCAPYHMVVPANVEIYVASAFNAAKDRIILTEISGNIIPEGTAVVLKGAASTQIELTYAEGNVTATAPAVNLFQGKATPSQIPAGQEARVLKGDEFRVLNTNTPYVRGFRAFLSTTAGGATRSQLAFPGVTGVDQVTTTDNNAEAPIFDLSGRRVEKPVAGQIYVQNGKKFLQR